MENKSKDNPIYKKLSRKSKSKFPLLYSSPNNIPHKRKIRNSESLTYRNNKFFLSLNETFLKRNYSKFIDKINKQKNYFNNNILSKNDLDTLLYKLKKNYNLITTITQKRNLEINKLNVTLQTEQEKLKKIIDFQEIELPEEKISLKKIGDTKMTKEELEKYLRDLVDEKRELDYKVYISNQYSKTVQYMLEEERKKVLNIQDEINQIQEKLNNFKRYHNLINDNLAKTKLKNNNYNELNEKLQNDINLANKIIKNNNEKNENLESKIILKEEKMDNLKQKIICLKESNKEEFEAYKEEIFNKIIKSKEDEEEKNKKEKKYIDIIYCLYILQKYFINQKKFDFQKLYSSKEYITIINNDNKSYNNNEINNNEENKIYINNKEENKNNDKNNNIIELKRIFNEINLKKENIFDFISKLSSRIVFNKKCLDNFHKKEISLNEKKENYSEKI